MYKMQPHPKLATLLKSKYESLYKASIALELNYDRLLNITRGRARPSLAEANMLSSFLKKTPQDIGLLKMHRV